MSQRKRTSLLFLQHAINPQGFKARNRFALTLEPDIVGPFSSWMLENGLGPGSEAQAVRELIRMQLSSTPLDGACEAMRMRAYHETRLWMIRRMQVFYEEIAADFRAGPRGAQGLEFDAPEEGGNDGTG